MRSSVSSRIESEARYFFIVEDVTLLYGNISMRLFLIFRLLIVCEQTISEESVTSGVLHVKFIVASPLPSLPSPGYLKAPLSVT